MSHSIFACFGFHSRQANQGSEPMQGELSPQQVHEALQAGAATLIDVREPMEFASERIHGALNMPLSTFDAKALPILNRQTLIFQCGSGKRSRTALDQFLKTRSEPAAHMATGIAGWKQAQLPVVRIDPATGRIMDPGTF
jgi:rhodanese-related sulfurtransferase